MAVTHAPEIEIIKATNDQINYLAERTGVLGRDLSKKVC
jgi:hypothetical protein